MTVLTVNESFTADGSSQPSNLPVSGAYVFFAFGTFGGGILALEASPDNGVTWLTVDQLPGSGRLVRELASGELVRLTLSGSVGPDIKAGLRE
tara:strand:- start:48 stop:326 length:279 start_codon:yes stop_codon:yes gene_type:complete